MKPYIISINGLDGSGKETTSKLLIETLKKDYKCVKNIEYVSFPDYTSKTGEIIKEILSGDYTHLPYKESSLARPYEIAKVFAANRTMYFANHPLQDDTIYIFDRYKESNILYQGLGRSGRDLLWFAQFLKEIDEENPDPNLSIFLQVPYMELRRRLDMREIVKAGIEHDHYEDDSFLKSVYHLSEYILLLEKGEINTYDLVISTGTGNTCLPPEAIVSKIIRTLINRNELIQFQRRE